MTTPPATLPTALRAAARWERLGPSGVPALVVVPPASAAGRRRLREESHAPCPVVLWMHGRTVNKELDPGRYLRWMRAGIGVCAVDLPGHGERRDDDLQRPERAFEVVERMLEEIDGVLEALWSLGLFDSGRVGIGGVSGGGMAALARLCEPHGFACASVEATCGSWASLRGRPIFTDPETWARARAIDPMGRLEQW
ncbi:MAG: alpha/beta fold hydrolase, partial [Planctomycetota bacterium]